MQVRNQHKDSLVRRSPQSLKDWDVEENEVLEETEVKEVKEVAARLTSEGKAEVFFKKELCQNRFIPHATFKKGNAGLLGATGSGHRGLCSSLLSTGCLVYRDKGSGTFQSGVFDPALKMVPLPLDETQPLLEADKDSVQVHTPRPTPWTITTSLIKCSVSIHA